MYGSLQMKEDLTARLNKIIERLESREFLENKGLGNEIGFYIFDYPPGDELRVRDYIKFIIEHLRKKRPDLRIRHVNLFELIVSYLKKRNLLESAINLQRDKGDDAVRKALAGPLHEEKIAKAFIEEAQPETHDIVLMSGIGNAWPLLRSHTLLNNLHPLMQMTPLVVFYPGVYNGQELSLFGRLGDNNYYRAFRLVP
jgi:hypothetical protein